MEEHEIESLVKRANNILRLVISIISIVVVIMVITTTNPDMFSIGEKPQPIVNVEEEVDRDLIEDGIHVRTGLKDAEGMFVVIANCTNCHSAKLLTQNRMTAERWDETIKWMQETQNLWDLGENQEVIVNYLVSNYPPNESSGRRSNLANIEWYEQDN